jgi:hypothetical protein
MKTYSLYLSTLSTINAPTNRTNLANCTWNVNWTQIFGQRTGECNVRSRINSTSIAGLNRDDNIGTIRCSLNSPTSNNYNGLILGTTEDILDYGVYEYLSLDTTQNGVSCNIPIGNGSFTISFLNMTENTLMTVVPEYQIILYFDVEDELHPDLFTS